MVYPLWKIIWQLLKKINKDLLYDPAILFLAIQSKELKTRITQFYLDAHSSIIHNYQKVETT